MTSYSQFETDLALAAMFPPGHEGTYIDIGASDPVDASNTYFFYQLGWRGICIDPLPECIERHAEARPGDIHIRAAIGQHDGEVDFYQHDGLDTLSSVSLAEAQRWTTYTLVRVPIFTLATVLRWDYTRRIPRMHPDILSIDVEGYEREVLEGCPFESGFLPLKIVIEATVPCTNSPTHDRWEHILITAGYCHVQSCGPNRIYALT